MKDKINGKTLALVNLIRNSKGKVLIFFFIIPILFLIVFFNLLEINQSNLFFMIIFLFNYYIAIFILVLIFARIDAQKVTQKVRRPFIVIKKLNCSTRPSYQSHFNMKTKERPLIGAEIGVENGDNATEILNFLNIKQLILVDPWKGYTDSWWEEDTSNPIDEALDDNLHESNYKETLKKFSNNSKVKIIRDYSTNAAKMFDNEYFDFVYIDGAHSYEEVKKDLESWYPKLKKFGVMCGDDYGNIHVPVIKAVSEFVYKHKLLVKCDEKNQFWFVKV